MPCRRKAPVKVMVFQWPCGIGARQRSPRGARPRRRVILVDTDVSSMKTSRAGSRSGWPSNHASRRAATSGRCCSLACAVFFKGHSVTVEEAPDRARREGGAVFAAQPLGQFDQRDVHLCVDLRQDNVVKRLDTMGALIATLRLGAGRARRAPGANPADRTRNRHPEPLGGGPPRHPGFDRHDQPDPQIFRQGLRHACWPPPPARMLNQISAASGKPPIPSGRVML